LKIPAQPLPLAGVETVRNLNEGDRVMKRIGIWALCLVVTASFALPASAGRSEDRAILAELADCPCTLSLAIEEALAVVPGTVAKARLKVSHKPGGEPVTFYKVVVFDETADRNVLRFDARTCEGIEPTLPEISMLDAIGIALVEVGGGIPVAAKLRFPGLEPVYKVVILLPRGRMVVFVDGVSGQVLGTRKWHRKRDGADDAKDAESEDDSL
jgi:hypothetical protein